MSNNSGSNTLGLDACPYCGSARDKYENRSGYPVGQVFECGTAIEYRMTVNAEFRVEFHEQEAERVTKACGLIQRMRPVYDAAMKPGATHYDSFSPEAEALKEAVDE